MLEVTLTVEHPVGLHARPAAIFVQTAKKFQSDVRVEHGERRANAKSILNVIGLGAGQGAEIVLRAEGEDEDQAIEALVALINDNFGEHE